MFRRFFLSRKGIIPSASRRGSTRLGVECLESRYCLSAGNVVATFNGGNLMLKGDNNDDGVSITPAAGGGVVVTGTGGTTINGAAAATFPGTVKNLHIKFGDGTDSVQIAGDPAVSPTLTISRDAQIELGKGADTVNIGDLIVGGQFQAKAGNGAADSVTIAPSASTIGLQVSKDAKIQLGNGNGDLLSIDALTAGHNLKAQLGKSDSDVFEIRNSSVSRDAEIQLGDGGQDFVGIFGDAIGHNLKVHLGNGDGDHFAMGDGYSRTTVSGDAQIELGNGKSDELNIVSLAGSEVKRNLSAKLGKGDNDSMVIEGLTVDKKATLQTGNGMNDTVHLASNSFGKTEKHSGEHTTEV